MINYILIKIQFPTIPFLKSMVTLVYVLKNHTFSMKIMPSSIYLNGEFRGKVK